MSCYRAAGYTTTPPEFHTDAFARSLVRLGASQAVAASQGRPRTRTQLIAKPSGLRQESGTQSSIRVWAQVSVHMNPRVGVFVISWY